MYNIIRFFKNSEISQVIKRNLTLEEAQEHCQKEDTREENFFDGYTEA